MLDILDIDEATVVSEIRMAQMQAEFEAMFNAPVTQMMAAQQAQQQMMGGNAPSPYPLPQGEGLSGGYDGTDW